MPADQSLRAQRLKGDLNVGTIVQAGIEPGSYEKRAVVYSGVFTPDGGVRTVPVVIAPVGVVTMDNPAAALESSQW